MSANRTSDRAETLGPAPSDPEAPARWALSLGRLSVRRPRATILGAILLVALAAPGLLRLELRTDGHALVPAGDPVILEDAELRERFGLRDPIVILVESRHADGIFNPETLARVQAITDAVSALETIGPTQVTSLATEARDKVFPGTLDFRPYLNPLPETPEQLEELRGDLDAADILYGTLVARDGRATSILVGVPAATGEAGRLGLYRQIRDLVAPFEGGTDRILVVGAPVAEALLGIHILEDLVVLLPLSLLVISLVIWSGCRRLWGVVLALTEVGACLVFTFGVMGWLGFPVYLTTAVLPVILTTIGLADEIHIFWHFQRALDRCRESGSSIPAVEETLSALGRPVVLSSLTTSLAFLSFLASPIAPVWSFGLFAALGTMFCMVWSLTVIPASLAHLPQSLVRLPSSGGGVRGRWLLPVGAVLARHRSGVMVAVVGATLAFAAGLPRLVVQDSWIDGFAPESAFRRATVVANEHLHGTHTLWAQLSFDPPVERIPETYRRQGPLLDPELIEAIGRVERAIAARPDVGGVLGPHAHLTTVSYLWQGRREELRAIPENPDRLERVVTRFEQGRGIHRRREVLDDALASTVIAVFLEEANFRDTADLLRFITDLVARELEPWRPTLDFGGDVAVSQAMIPAIVKTQVVSLALAICGAFLVVWGLGRSLPMALLAVAPTACAVVWVLGAMGWLGIPLGVATSMFCAITLGIGVDYAIHLLGGFRRARLTGRSEPALHALREAGPAILFDALAIAAGFGLLLFSQVPANARLGLLVAAALFASCCLTLLGLGALLIRPAADRGRATLAPGEVA